MGIVDFVARKDFVVRKVFLVLVDPVVIKETKDSVDHQVNLVFADFLESKAKQAILDLLDPEDLLVFLVSVAYQELRESVVNEGLLEPQVQEGLVVPSESLASLDQQGRRGHKE